MAATLLFALLGGVCAVVAWREWMDRGSAGRLGDPLLIPVVLLAACLLVIPMFNWLGSVAGNPLILGLMLGGVCLLFVPYLCTHLANLLAAGLSGAPSMPAGEENIFEAAQRANRIGSSEMAITEYRRVLDDQAASLRPEQIADAYQCLAELLPRCRRNDEAFAAASAAAATQALSPAERIRLGLLLAEIHEELGRPDDAVRVLERCRAFGKTLSNDKQGRQAVLLLPTVAERLRAASWQREHPVENLADLDLSELSAPETPRRDRDDEINENEIEAPDLYTDRPPESKDSP